MPPAARSPFTRMQDLLEALPSNEAIRDFLNSPSTWWQIGIFLAGLLLAKLIGDRLLPRLQSVTKAGGIEGVGRTAVRSGALALVPAAAVAVAAGVFRHPAQSGLAHRPAAPGDDPRRRARRDPHGRVRAASQSQSGRTVEGLGRRADCHDLDPGRAAHSRLAALGRSNCSTTTRSISASCGFHCSTW